MSTLKTNAIQTTAGKPILNSTGSILQVVQTVFKTTFSVTSNLAGWTAITDFTASITPSSASSKILVNMYIATGKTYYQWRGRLTRGGATVSGALGDLAGSRPQSTISNITVDPSASDANYELSFSACSYLDSPATTSSITYGMEIGGYNDSYPIYVNRSNRWQDTSTYDGTPISTITLFEISG